METLNEYPKITVDFLKQQWIYMVDRADWIRRTTWLKKKYKWLK